MSQHDFTQPYWGHNVSITLYDPTNQKCQGFCWVTPGLKNEDTILIKSRIGTMKLRVFNVQWMTNVDDMYKFDAEPLESYPKENTQNQK